MTNKNTRAGWFFLAITMMVVVTAHERGFFWYYLLPRERVWGRGYIMKRKRKKRNAKNRNAGIHFQTRRPISSSCPHSITSHHRHHHHHSPPPMTTPETTNATAKTLPTTPRFFPPLAAPCVSIYVTFEAACRMSSLSTPVAAHSLI